LIDTISFENGGLHQKIIFSKSIKNLRPAEELQCKQLRASFISLNYSPFLFFHPAYVASDFHKYSKL